MAPLNRLVSFTKAIAVIIAMSGCAIIQPIDAQAGVTEAPLSPTLDNPLFMSQALLIDANPSDLDAPTDPMARIQQTDIWQRIRNGYQLLPKSLPHRVAAFRKDYLRRPEYLATVLERARPFIYHITQALDAADMPLELALLPVIESAYDPLAYSRSHAAGLWQFIPKTGEYFGLPRTRWYDGRRDIVESTHAAITYLKYLHRHFNNDWLLALAAYNIGEGSLARKVKANRSAGGKGDFWSLRLPRETYNYVPKLLALADLVKNPQHYAVDLPNIANQPYFDAISIGSPIEVAVVLQETGLTNSQFSHLNPAFKRSITPPTGQYQLLIPVGHSLPLKNFLADNNTDEWVSHAAYQVVSGDTLSSIALRHKIPTPWLMQANNLRTDRLSIGMTLRIPASDQALSSRTRNASRPESDYRVIRGDTLSEIAERFAMPMTTLRRLNDLESDTLQVGQSLRVYGNTSKKEPHAIRKITYRVRSGDSLYLISRAFQVAIAEITAWNQIDRSTPIQPGQRLTLFVNALTI